MVTVKQDECGVTVFRVGPLPAVLLQEERRVFLELIQFSESVIQAEGEALSLLWQRIMGMIVRQLRMGVRERGARRRVIRRCPSTSF